MRARRWTVFLGEVNQHAYVNGVRRKDLESLSPSMWKMIFDLKEHGDAYYSRSSRSEYGGANGTFAALTKRGFLTNGFLSRLGYESCKVEWSDPKQFKKSCKKDLQDILTLIN